MTHLAALSLLLGSLLTGPNLMERHSLLLKASVGDTFAYEMRSVSHAGPSEAVFSSRYEMTIMALEPKGTATFKTEQKQAKLTIGGKERILPGSVVTAKLKLDGEVISIEPPSSTPEQARTSRIMQYEVPNDEVKVGQTWAWKDPESPLNGNVSAEGSGVCVRFAKHNGKRCAELRISLQETEGSSPASSSFDVWLSLKDGMMVDNSMSLENVPLSAGRLVKMDVTVKRVEARKRRR